MFTIGQQVTVIDGGWTGTIEKIDPELQAAAYIRFPGRPDLPAYAFEALRPAAMFDTLTPDEREALYFKLHGWAHELYVVGHALGRAALVHRDYGNIAWDWRQEYLDARSEICDLITELAA